MTIPFQALVGGDNKAFSSKADNQRSVNCYIARVDSDQGVNPFVLYKSPGLLPYITSLKTGPVRGMMSRDVSSGFHGFIVVADTVYDVMGQAVSFTYGPIADDGDPVYMAASPTSLMIVSDGVLYRINGGALSTISLSFTPRNVVFLKNYFVVLSDALQQFYWSSNDGATFPAANVQTLEADANATLTMAVIHQQLYFVGTRITQVFYVGPRPQAPFVPNDGAVIRSGTRAPASLKALGSSLFWLESDQDGQNRVVECEGYTVKVVSTNALSNTIREYQRDHGTDDAIGMAYEMNGQQFYRLTFPTADKTWEYNRTTNTWSEIISQDWPTAAQHRHRGMSMMSAFGRILVGDHSNGIVYEMSPDIYHDAGFPLPWFRQAPHIVQGNHNIALEEVDLGIQTGVGLVNPLWLNDYSLSGAAFASALAQDVIDGDITAAQSTVLQQIYDGVPYVPLDPYPSVDVMDALGFFPWGAQRVTSGGTVLGDVPSIYLRYSHDGGESFSAELRRSMGQAGTQARPSWMRLGVGRDVVVRIGGSDPVKYAVTTAWIDAQELAS